MSCKLTLTNEDNMVMMKRYPDKYFDLAVIDPPYNIVSQQKRGIGSRIDKSGKMNEWNHKAPQYEFFTELFRVSKNQIIWGANNFILPPTEYFLIWSKKQTVSNFATAEYAWCSPKIKIPAKIFEFSIHKTMAIRGAEGGKIHPTQKPERLYKFILDTYAKPGYKIVDTHLGSGSIAIACYFAGYDLTACEIDKQYFDNAKKRIEKFVKNPFDFTAEEKTQIKMF